ncbi:MAG TPA: hypothetical protein VNT57_03365 [Desulfobacteria bacterium]|nr:hypothetical protein [Desulfobacteria bacterium]
MEKDEFINKIYSAWLEEDRDSFKLLVGMALYRNIDKGDILQLIGDNKSGKNVDEDFEEWAYRFITTNCMSDCPPG